jgi:hypothetical protein
MISPNNNCKSTIISSASSDEMISPTGSLFPEADVEEDILLKIYIRGRKENWN